MKVVIAIDSLKGSLSSMDAGNAIKNGILKAVDAEVIVCPLADGGEGTTDALIEGMGGEKITLTVNGPLGAPTEAFYGYLKMCIRDSICFIHSPCGASAEYPQADGRRYHPQNNFPSHHPPINS